MSVQFGQLHSKTLFFRRDYYAPLREGTTMAWNPERRPESSEVTTSKIYDVTARQESPLGDEKDRFEVLFKPKNTPEDKTMLWLSGDFDDKKSVHVAVAQGGRPTFRTTLADAQAQKPFTEGYGYQWQILDAAALIERIRNAPNKAFDTIPIKTL